MPAARSRKVAATLVGLGVVSGGGGRGGERLGASRAGENRKAAPGLLPSSGGRESSLGPGFHRSFVHGLFPRIWRWLEPALGSEEQAKARAAVGVGCHLL